MLLSFHNACRQNMVEQKGQTVFMEKPSGVWSLKCCVSLCLNGIFVAQRSQIRRKEKKYVRAQPQTHKLIGV